MQFVKNDLFFPATVFQRCVQSVYLLFKWLSLRQFWESLLHYDNDMIMEVENTYQTYLHMIDQCRNLGLGDIVKMKHLNTFLDINVVTVLLGRLVVIS